MNYIAHLKQVSTQQTYDVPEAFINLPFNEKIIKSALAVKDALVLSELKYILVIGIGGSNLGTKAIYDALYGHFDNLESNRFPKILFLDTVEPVFLDKLLKFVSENVKKADDLVINLISESGTTTESLFNFKTFIAGFPQFQNRVVITTTEKSPLWQQPEYKHKLAIPQKISGRYSIFSNVGLFPLACANIDIVSLLEGAMEATKECLQENNQAMQNAAAAFQNLQNKKVINENIYFAPQLESLGKWHRQLVAESLGKDKKGFTPTVAIGSTDMHSMTQLHLGGPQDKFFNFVSVKNDHSGAAQVQTAILESVKQAYKNAGLFVTETVLPSISEKALGRFMQTKMFEIIFLAQLLSVNAFDQPNVEDYKKATKIFLQNLHEKL